MSLQILGDDSAETIERIRSVIEAAMPCQEIDVRPGSPRHYTIRVISEAFVGLSRVKQQRLVYAAISELMAGDSAPVHAVDSLECVTP